MEACGSDMEMLKSLPPDSAEQQEYVTAIQDEDGYNWGYNPVLWGVPKGSYATNPNGSCRIMEFRKMVQALNRLGLRVVLDVVYNHLHGSGTVADNSVLDKIVPGYYLRRNADGFIENSTCVNNTASEHFMVDRLIVDDLLNWAHNYKVGMAANLKEFVLTNCDGQEVKGLEVLTYGGAPDGYASEPVETINYVSAHDNETLFDIISLKTPMEISVDKRCRINHLATSVIALSQESESEDEGLDEIDDENDEEDDHELKMAAEKKLVVQKPAEKELVVPKDDIQLSKKELKKKELAELEAVLAEFGLAESSGQQDSRGSHS